MVADFWSFSYGRNKRLRSVQEVQPAVIADPFHCSEVSCADVCYVFAPRRIMSWFDFDWRYECVLCHSNKGQNKVKEGLEVIGSYGRSLCVVRVWFLLLHLWCSVQTIHSDTVHRFKQTHFFSFSFISLQPSFPLFSESRWWSHGFVFSSSTKVEVINIYYKTSAGNEYNTILQC